MPDTCAKRTLVKSKSKANCLWNESRSKTSWQIYFIAVPFSALR